MKDEDRYIELMLKEADQGLTAQEQEELDLWLKDSDANQEKAAKIREAWSKSSQPQLIQNLDLDKEYAAVQQKIARHRRRISIRGWSVAAAAVLLISSGLIGVFMHRSSKGKSLVITGPVAQYNLEDGSTVWLKEDSKLEVHFNNEVRNLSFAGQGFFDVAPNPDRPFQLSTEKGLVTVTGTSFEVQADLSRVKVVVASGRVNLFNPEKEVIQLTAGESGQSSDAGFEKIPSIQPAGAWILEPISYQQTEFSTILKKIEAQYHLRFTTETPAPLSCKVTFTLNYPEKTVLFQLLETLLDIHIEKISEVEYHITGQGC